MRTIQIETIEDTITRNNAEEIAFFIRDRIGGRPFDLTIRNQLARKADINTNLRLRRIAVSVDTIVLHTDDEGAALIDLNDTKYVVPPRISANHLRIQIVQYLPHRVQWNMLIR